MKKIIAIALILVMLCGAVSVFADTELTTPSKTTDDLTTFEVTVESPVDGKAVAILPINENTVDDITKYQANLDAAEAELEKAQNAKTLEAYFGNEVAEKIAAILGDNAGISMDEFLAVIEQGYEDGMGNATVTAQVATPYEKDEKVAVMIGILKDGALTWNAYEAVGLEDGRIQFTVDAETMKAIGTDIALLAVCSK